MGALNGGGVTQQEITDAMSSLMEKDRIGTTSFLKERMMVAPGDALPPQGIKEFDKVGFYMNFRFGGLGYGPRFRDMQRAYSVNQTGNPWLCCAFRLKQTTGKR